MKKLFITALALLTAMLVMASCTVGGSGDNGSGDGGDGGNSSCEHNFQYEKTKDPTCTEKGSEKGTCTLCSEQTVRDIEALGHDMKQIDGKAASCTEDGWEDYEKCSRCDESTYKKTDKLGHDMKPVDGKAASCTEDGWEDYEKCSRCDESTYTKIDKLGHDLESFDAKLPTETEVGWNAYEACKRCSYSTYEELPATPVHIHAYGEWQTVTAATCTEDGEKIRYCIGEDCQASETGIIEALGHDEESHEAKAATCLDEGYKAYVTCKREGCGYTTYEKTSALGHDEKLIDGKEPTCEDNGYEPYVYCAREGCNYKTYKKLDALGHNEKTVSAKEPTSEEIGWNEHTVCERCGEKFGYVEIPKVTYTAEVLPVKGGAEGIAVIVHDDGNVTTVYELEKLFYKYNLVGTLALMSNNGKTTENLMTWKQVLATGRWKVASHSATHTWWGSATDDGNGGYIFADNETKVNSEIVASQRILRELFPGQRVLTFIYPGFATEKNTYVGAYSGEVGTEVYNKIREFIYSPASRELIAETYIGARYDSTLSANGATVDNVLDYYYMNGGFINNSAYTNGTLAKRLQNAANGGFEIFSLHYCSGESSDEISPANMDAFCALLADYVEEGKIWNTFYEDAVLYTKEAQNSTVKVLGSDTELRVNLTDTLNNDIYDYALTVRVGVPVTWEAAKIVQNGNTSYAAVKSVSGVKVIDADITPDKGEAIITPVALSAVPEEEDKTPAAPIQPTNDSVIDFENDLEDEADALWVTATSNSESCTAGITTVEGNKVLQLNKTASMTTNPYVMVKGGTNSVKAATVTLTFDIYMKSGSTSNPLVNMSFASLTPYRPTIIRGTDGFNFGDIEGINGRNDNVTSSLAYDTWHTVTLKMTLVGQSGFLAEWYKDTTPIGSSTNYYGKTTEGVASAINTSVEYVKFTGYQPVTFCMYLDNLSMVTTEITNTPTTPPDQGGDGGGSGTEPDQTLPTLAEVDFATDPGISGTGASVSDGVLNLSKDFTGSMANWKIPLCNPAKVVEAFTFTFDINVASATTTFASTLLFADGNNNPYMLTLIPSGSGYYLGDCQSNSGSGTRTNFLTGDTPLSFNSWYTVKIEVITGINDGNFKATWYVKDSAGEFQKTGESTNFGNQSKSDTATPQGTLQYFKLAVLSAAEVDMKLDNILLQGGDLPEKAETPVLDKTFTFDSSTEGLSGTTNVTYESATPTGGTSNALHVTKNATGTVSALLNAGSTASNIGRFVLEFDINLDSVDHDFASSSSVIVFQQAFTSSLSNTPYDLTLIAYESGYKFGDLSNASGGTSTVFAMDALNYGSTYHIKLNAEIGADGSFLATLYVDGDPVGTSSNYYKTTGTSNPPNTSVNAILFYWQSAAKFDMYLDNLSLKAYEPKTDEDDEGDTPSLLPADSPKKDGYISFTEGSDARYYEGSAHTVEGGKLYINTPAAWATTGFLFDNYSPKAPFNTGAKYIFEGEYTYLGGSVMPGSTGLGFIGFLHNTTIGTESMNVLDTIRYGSDTDGDGTPDSVSFFGNSFTLGVTYNLKFIYTTGSTSIEVYIDGVQKPNFTSSSRGVDDSIFYGFGMNYRGIIQGVENIGEYSCCFDNVKVSAEGVQNMPEFGELLENGHRVDVNFFPGYVRKTVSFTIDDGDVANDTKLLNILKPVGIKGTFNIFNHNVSTETQNTYKTLYDGYEVANHHILHTTAWRDGFDYSNVTFSDEYLPSNPADIDTSVIYKKSATIDGTLVPEFYYVDWSLYNPGSTGGWHPLATDDTYIEYLELTTEKIEALFGEGSVVGFAYPHGTLNENIKNYLKNSGKYLYARKTGNLKDTTGFALPEDRFAWTYNADHNCLLDVMQKFDRYADDGELKMFTFGVHAKDFQNNNKWDDLQTFADLYGNRPEDFWYATNREIFEYEDAINGLVITNETISNPSSIDVFIKVDNQEVEIKAGGVYTFEN